MLRSGQTVIALRASGGGGPYTYDGRPYQRIGPTTSRMPREQLDRLLVEKMHTAHRWENQPAVGIDIQDLDSAEIARTVDEAIRRGRMEDPGTRDPHQILLGLGLIRDGELLNAAVVLFGRADRLMSSYPQCLLRMARFPGRTKADFLDNRQEVGNAFEIFVRAQQFLRDHLPVAGRVVPDLFERIDDPIYPPEALREALANAICHRDYAIGGGAVSVAIYDNRLEISSSGILPFGLTAEDLTHSHQSRPWNPLIAQVFYRRGLIESWGRGTLKMLELAEQAGLVPPEFEVSGGEVLVRFWPISDISSTRDRHDLSTLQRELLQILARTGPTSLNQIRSLLRSETPVRTVQDNLQMLRRLELVDLVGAGRGARWMLKDVQQQD